MKYLTSEIVWAMCWDNLQRAMDEQRRQQDWIESTPKTGTLQGDAIVIRKPTKYEVHGESMVLEAGCVARSDRKG